MYYDFKVKIPEVKGKIYERMIKGVVYINYEYDRIYKPDKKYNIPKRTTIGKKCEDDPEMMYPNPNFLTYFPDAELPEDQGRDARSSCLRIGTWIVIEKLMVESLLDKIISDLYSDDRGTGKSRIRSIFPMILPIRTARPVISRSLNSDMPRKTGCFRSSTIT